MAAVVEFQAFYDNNDKFVIKEFVIVGDSFQTQVIFKSPYCKCTLNDKQQRAARWLIRHFHGIKWEEGNIEYNENLISSLCSNFQIIYTKGYDKVQFLKRFHSKVYELPPVQLYVSPTEDVKSVCLLPHHNNDRFKCALRCAHLEYKSLQRH